MYQIRTSMSILILLVVTTFISARCGSAPPSDKYSGTVYYAGTGGLWKMTLPDRQAVLLLNKQVLRGIALSPDQKWLLYYDSISREGEWFSSLWMVSTQGGEPIQVSDYALLIVSNGWEDGWLRYTELADFFPDPIDPGYTAAGHSATYLFNLETRERRLESESDAPMRVILTPGTCRRLAVAPGDYGDAVEKCLDMEDNGFLRVINLDGTDPITIPVHYKDGAVAWSDDGEWLAFGGGEVEPGMPRPFLWNRFSGDIRQIGSGTPLSNYIFSDPSWSPDSQWLAFNSSDESLCVAKVESGDVKCFEGYLSAIGTAPEWSPDSQAIMVSSNRIGKLVMGDSDLVWDLFIISVPDGVVTRVTNDSKVEHSPIWVP